MGLSRITVRSVALRAMAACVFVFPAHRVMAQQTIRQTLTPPLHGSYETTAGENWEQAFVTGNGRMGAMLFGQPGEETFVANHCRLFLPKGNREIVPDLARWLPEMRRLWREKGPDSAQAFIVAKGKEQNHPELINTDPYHPGFFINIHQGMEGVITGYSRTEDFRTGEVLTSWRDSRGEYRRRLFVSRPDNLIVLSISGPGTCTLEFPQLDQPLINSRLEVTTGWVGYHNTYLKGKGGYDAGVRIIQKGGKIAMLGGMVTVSESKEILLLMRIVPWKTPLSPELSEAWDYSPQNPDFTKPGLFNPTPAAAESSVVAYRADADALALMPALRTSFNDLKPDYEELFARHAQQHRELFDRVTVDLNGGAGRLRTTTDLLDEAGRTGKTPAALMEKMFDAGRYMLICSAGELLPNLHGIWNGTWTPAWSGDFTLDTNVQSAMASACSAGLSDLMEGYFRRMEAFYPEWRINARRLYGCRGVLTNPRASNTALMLHWGDEWPGNTWTAGCGWLASFFAEYADYTADRNFIAQRCIPLLSETAQFYRDFLSEKDSTGKLVFTPSYNPETGYGTNATMDISVLQEVLSNLIRYSRDLNSADTAIPGWEAMLASLPALPVNNGALVSFPGGEADDGHRHHSQLYGCFQSFDPVFLTDSVLRRAAQTTVRLKIAGSDGGGEQSSFGRVQCGISAAYLGMDEEAYGRLNVMAVKRSMYPSLITSHEPGARIFNADGNGGIPQIMAMMLVFSTTDHIDLLPALPAEWPDGSIRGLRLRNGCTIDLKWSGGRLKTATLHAGRNTLTTIRYQGKTKQIRLKKDASITLNE